MPDLVTVPNVHLVSVGTWNTSTGKATFTAGDLAAAVEAQDDPAIRTPIVKLGHIDPRFDGEPAVGRIENLRTSDDGLELYGDLVGVPSWLADVMGSAFPSRSVEGYHGWLDSTGAQRHQFVLTALALLGVTIPAIETLDDIKALYEGDLVAAAKKPADGVPFNVTFKEGAMPKRVEASVNIDTVRTEFYETQPPGSWAWVREVWSDFIVVDNDEGDLYRIPWSEEGEGEIKFGTPEKVVVQYVPAPGDDDADSEGSLVLMARFRPMAGQPVAASAAPTAPLPGQKGGPAMDFTKLRTSLGLAPETTDEQVLDALVGAATYAAAERDALATQLATPPTPAPAPTSIPDGAVLIDGQQLSELQAAARLGTEAHTTLRTQERERFIQGVVAAGRLAPANTALRGSLEREWDRDPVEAAKVAANLAVVAPTAPLGHAGAGDNASDDALFDALFPQFAGKEG